MVQEVVREFRDFVNGIDGEYFPPPHPVGGDLDGPLPSTFQG